MKCDFRASFNGFHLDQTLGIWHEKAGIVKLQTKELGVLQLLVRYAERLVTKDELSKVVWGDRVPSDSSIARCISRIKSALDSAAPGSSALIQTTYGKGYCFVGEVTSSLSYLSEDCFNTLINLSPSFIAFKDDQGRWLAANLAAQKLFNLEMRDWLGKTDQELVELLPPVYQSVLEGWASSDALAWKNKLPTKSLEMVVQANGIKRYLEVTRLPTCHEDSDRNVLVIYGHDVTEIKSATDKIMLADHVLENSSEAVVITDANNQILSVNRAFTAISGYAEKEVIGKNPRIFSSGRHAPSFYQSMWRQIGVEGVWRGEVWDRRKSGEIYPKWLDISTVHDANGHLTNHVGIFSDLTERKSIEEKIEFLAYHDPLTQLPNRMLLRDRFEQAIASAGREKTMVAFLFLDLDKFKQVNDSLGHVVGDEMLKLVSERLTRSVRDSDTVARFGGDEFVVLLTNLRDESAIPVAAEKILAELSEPFFIGDVELNSSSSIGVACYPGDGMDFDTLLKMADVSMYQAKRSGANTYRFFTEKMNVDAVEQLHLQNSLRQAIKKSEFTLHYQPQFEADGNRLIGVEALIRWHGEQGTISPAKFIPAAEESGLIIAIGEWVLYEACRQARAWQVQGGFTHTIAINLSAVQFRRGDIVETVKGALKSSGLKAKFLELELTESILIQDVEYVLEVLKELKQLGVSLSIDDFGTGYSSLAYLKKFPVDKLKIDQSFVCNMTNDANDAAIVHSVIQLAHNLKLKVIAEGVETQKQAEHLRREGCDEVQGYYFGHPMPAAELQKLLQSTVNRMESADNEG